MKQSNLQKSTLFSLVTACFIVFGAHAWGQGGGGPGGGGPGGGGPPPPVPLPAQPIPPGNPSTTEKINLGKALFWDEQLSSTRTVACGTCHQPSRGGVDPRTVIGSVRSTHPGPDGVFGNADDVNGSIGLPLSNADGTYDLDAFFGLGEQVTGRYPPTMINAGHFPNLFWDGRATGTFRDPVSGTVILPNGGALESQASSPPTGSSEMAHQGRNWTQVADRVAGSIPLALATSVPAALETWINGRDYPTLFSEAFGDSAVTPARIVMAIATYERTLNSDQTPWDLAAAAAQPLANFVSAAAARGQGFFNGPGRCATCHSGNLFSDRVFHNLGIRPQNGNEDQGRFEVTGNNGDRQAFKTPTLRNVALHGQFMHNGRFETLGEVVDFYARGGDFPSPAVDITPFAMSPGQRADLIAFLTEALTDPRVQNETAPFDRPALYLDSPRMPVAVGAPVPGSGGLAPQIVAIEPPLAGNPNCTIGVANALGGAMATLVVDTNEPPVNIASIDTNAVTAIFTVTLDGTGTGGGYGSVPFAIPVDPALVGNNLYARWYVSDPDAAGGVAVTPSARMTVFPAPVPIASADVVMRNAGGGSRISSIALMANDIAGAAGGALTLMSVTQPVSGQASVAISGSNVFYTPQAGFSGVDQFTYEIMDASGYTSSAIVQVGVNEEVGSPNSGVQLAAEMMPAGQLKLNFVGIPGFTYRIQETSSLAEPIIWQDSGSTTADALGKYELTVTPMSAPAFFRAVYP